MDVQVTVTEQDIKTGLRKIEPMFVALATVNVGDKRVVATGYHVDQSVAEALAIAELKTQYRIAFPPVKLVVTKTLSVDFDA